MKKNHFSEINLVYFAANFPHDFIYKVWEGNLAAHFSNKLEGIVLKENRQCCDFNCFFKFFCELTTDNQELLCSWIHKNYSYRK